MRDCQKISRGRFLFLYRFRCFCALPLKGERGRGSGRGRAVISRRDGALRNRGERGGSSASGAPTGGKSCRGGVEPKAGDHREAMPVPRINGDPFAAAATSIFAEFLGTHRRRNKSGCPQSIRDSAGTIVSGIFERTMAASVAVRLRTKLVGSPNGPLYCERRIRGRGGHATPKPRLFARNDWARRRKRTGNTALDQEGQNRSTKQCLPARGSHEV